MNPSGERCKYKETWVERQKEDGTGGDVCPATHAVTHEQKNGAETTEKSVSAGEEIPRQTRFILPKARGRRSYRILSLSLLNFSIRLQLVFSGEDRVLTHAVTHEQKKRGGNNGEKRICGCENPVANPLYSPKIRQKAALSNLHTHEATGSSPVVSTKNHRNHLIPVIFFRNPQLFEVLNF